MLNKKALLIGFTYHNTIVDRPLKGIDLDLLRMTNLCRDRFNIPSKNISIITDSDRESLKNHAGYYKHTKPYLTSLVKEIANFINGLEETDEVLFYYSGHGCLLGSEKIGLNRIDSSLLLINDDNSQQCYLRNTELHKLLFQEIKGITYHSLGKVESDTIFHTCKGLAKTNKLLSIFDACYSENLLDLLNRQEQAIHATCISSSRINSITFSTEKGSPFTTFLCEFLDKNLNKVSSKELYEQLKSYIDKKDEKVWALGPNFTTTFDSMLPLL
jgi:hypothetical protein